MRWLKLRLAALIAFVTIGSLRTVALMRGKGAARSMAEELSSQAWKYIEDRNFQGGVFVARSAIAVDRKYFGGYYALGRCLRKLHNPEAEPVLQSGLTRAGTPAGQFYFLAEFGTLASDRGRFREAVPLLIEALQLNPADRGTRHNLERALRKLGLSGEPVNVPPGPGARPA